MTRPTRPGSIQAAVAEAFRACGGLDSVSADLGLALSTLSYATELRDDRPGGLGVAYLGRMEPGAALPIARHFAALAGCVVQPVTSGGVASVHEVTREFSDVLALHAQAMAGAGYSAAAAARQVLELDQLIAAATRLRAAMLAGGQADV